MNPNADTTESSTPERAGRGATVLNWAFALLTVPVAIVVLVVALGGVMSLSGCTGNTCQAPGPGLFTVLFYGAPVISALTLFASFVTARRRWGIAVPLAALGLQVVALVVLVFGFS
ncbi:MAG TPA: hypothetical protein VH496_13495 [Mycobacterium sp.]|jgi:hypothetical protein